LGSSIFSMAELLFINHVFGVAGLPGSKDRKGEERGKRQVCLNE
jgi:hypothetical protein